MSFNNTANASCTVSVFYISVREFSFLLKFLPREVFDIVDLIKNERRYRENVKVDMRFAKFIMVRFS